MFVIGMDNPPKMFPSNLAKRTNFPNVAGVTNCDILLEKELYEAHIPIRSGYDNWRLREGTKPNNGIIVVKDWDSYIYKYRSKSEVPYHVIGNLGDGKFIFKRAWYYWMVKGNVPIKIANQLYKDPLGEKDVRVVGHCGCPPPKKWAENIDGKKCITSYHIDSQEGLNLFVKSLKDSGVV